MKAKKVSAAGYVYILTSRRTEYIKIGGTDYPPLRRLKEINANEPYKSLGPWTLTDFRHVTDWRKIEYALHYTFRSKLVKSIFGQRELFELSAQKASAALEEIEETEILGKPKIDRMFQDEEFAYFILKFFGFTGLLNWLDIQGAWTFVLFPNTNGGRYFTINIGTHEVAFSTLPKKDHKPIHMILMDRLILDFDDVVQWLQKHDGGIWEGMYATALPRSASVQFKGTFADAHEFLLLDGVRRALIAYWTEALIELKERSVLSVHSRFHNWNAVAEINNRYALISR